MDSQGVVQHRVDQIKGVDGKGITIGVLSDSYDVRELNNPDAIRAADDVASGDLPGTGHPLGNTEPVVVLEDIASGSDEGRAMMQLIHDMAPKARLGFATAFGGEVWQQLELTFRSGSFGRHDILSFGIDRDEADSAGTLAAVGRNSADLLGGGILIPEGTFARGGVDFFGKFEDGRKFKGQFTNFLGSGYSPLDGFGFINAERAVKSVQKKKRK